MFEFTLACMGKGKYDCPIDAGPSRREACEAGFGMFELEENLKLTGWERLLKHDKKFNELLEFEAFMTTIHRGGDFIQSPHVHPR